jgi:hypothetical protein
MAAAPAPEYPFLDEISRVVHAPAAAVCGAVEAFFAAEPHPIAKRYGRLVGVQGERAFNLHEKDRPHRLVFTADHDYAHATLTFVIEEDVSGATLLRLQSRADFPGTLGTLYRTAVIGTRFHVLAVRWMLKKIAERAEGL